MRVILEPCPGAVITGKDKEGNEVQLESVAVTPFFSSAQGHGGVVLGKAITQQGKAVDSFMIRASGTTGKITKGERPSGKSVIPAVDKPSSKDPGK